MRNYRYNRKTYTYTLKDLVKDFKVEFKGSHFDKYTEKQLHSFIQDFHVEVLKKVVLDIRVLILPYRMGSLLVKEKKVDGVIIDIYKLFQTGQLMPMLNHHTFGKIFHMGWDKEYGTAYNIKCYKYRTSTPVKRVLHKRIMDGATNPDIKNYHAH